MVAESSRSRESTTRVSRSPHWGQRIALLWLDHHYHLWCGTSIPLHGGQGRDWRAGTDPSAGWSGGGTSSTGGLGVTDDRLPGVDEVEVPAFDRRLGLDLPPAPTNLGQDLRAVVHHGERALGTLELLDDRVADGDPRRRALQGAGLVGVAGDRVGRGLDGRTDRVGPELTPADGIDAAGCSVERLVDPRGEFPDRRPEALDLACATMPAGPPQHDEDSSARATNAATGSMTGRSATVMKARTASTLPCPKLGEDGVAHLDQIADHDHVGEIRDGRIRIPVPATIVDAVMPTLCWMAPLMPIAR